MRISDWSSDVCSSDLLPTDRAAASSSRCEGSAAQWQAESVGGCCSATSLSSRSYRIHTSHAGEARSRHTKAVVPALLAGTQCPSRLKVLPLKSGAFAAGGDAMVARRRHASMPTDPGDKRSEEHTSELQSLLRISYA